MAGPQSNERLEFVKKPRRTSRQQYSHSPPGVRQGGLAEVHFERASDEPIIHEHPTIQNTSIIRHTIPITRSAALAAKAGSEPVCLQDFDGLG